MFEGTYVPLVFEQALVPRGSDPDGLGPLTDVDRRLRIEYESVRKREPGWEARLKRLCREYFGHQKYQLKNSHGIADQNGERADNMNIEDICPPLGKINVLNPYNPGYAFLEGECDCRYEIAPWVFEACEREGTALELIANARLWNDNGAFELSPYPGDRAIDGDGNYPIFLPPEPEEDLIKKWGLELPPEYENPPGAPRRTQSKSFTDHQWPKGFCPNPAGRPPRSLREIEDIDDQRPHFFDTLMPPDSRGRSITYGEAIYWLSRSRASDADDYAWIAQTDEWGRQLACIRAKRKVFRNGGYVYNERLEVTRIDIAIRHLGLVEVQWRKSPSARWLIRPWIVSEALERMEDGSLTREDMEVIYLRTKTPQHVDWPDWWPEDLRSKHSKNDQIIRQRRKISGTLTKA